MVQDGESLVVSIVTLFVCLFVCYSNDARVLCLLALGFLVVVALSVFLSASFSSLSEDNT